MAIQIAPKVTRDVTPAKPVTRDVTQPVTRNVTREEFETLQKMVAALKAVVDGLLAERIVPAATNKRAAYMREYRKRPKKGI